MKEFLKSHIYTITFGWIHELYKYEEETSVCGEKFSPQTVEQTPKISKFRNDNFQ